MVLECGTRVWYTPATTVLFRSKWGYTCYYTLTLNRVPVAAATTAVTALATPGCPPLLCSTLFTSLAAPGCSRTGGIL